MDTVVLAPAGYLLDPDIGSDYERPWRLAQGLAQRGLRVVIVARDVRKMGELGSGIEFERPPGRLPNSHIGRMVDRANLYLHARRVAYREVRSGRALVIHHLGPCGNGSPSLIGKLQIPFVYGPVPATLPADFYGEEWQSWIRSPKVGSVQARLGQSLASQARPLAHFLRRRTLRRADAITVEAPSEMFSGQPNMVVIRPGIDADIFKPTSGEHRAGRILAVGRLLPRKGYDVLIRAIGRVVKSCPSAHLLLVGSGPHERALQTLARDLGIDSSVTFAGNVSRMELIGLLQSAEVFCHPARWESFFPAAPLEAMACGLPMAVSSAGALPELVGDFAGRIHQPGDDAELAESLLEILTSRELRNAFGRAARAQIVAHFTWDGMCDSYHDLYRRLSLARPAIQ